MRLTVNGKEYTTEKDTVTQLLKELDIIPERVAVEVNLKVIRRVDFESFSLKEGDSVEIVYFVGGGQEPACSGRQTELKNEEAGGKAWEID